MDAGPLLTVREAALALNCSPDTVRRRIAEGEIVAVQLGGRGKAIRVPADELDCWLMADPPEDAAP
jgi:excisionase family DNA binding protein